ncbi:hypothetical protein NM688_g8563 [Phlebia brevispora]|uniref:Uncharacterized protein n=1 Tax=Phlebia brevispora TaxID=194682 RepID=A0ACC1RQ62_9APHY|nr:hypothetical protein NM688_g8563 [Phlebia brevispora]
MPLAKITSSYLQSRSSQKCSLDLTNLDKIRADLSLWRTVILHDATLARKVFDLLEESSELAAAVHHLQMDLTGDQESSQQLFFYAYHRLIKLLKKMPRLWWLRLIGNDLDIPAILTSLCALEESNLTSLTLTTSTIQEAPWGDREAITEQDLELRAGKLEYFHVECRDVLPRASVMAMARLLETSAHIIESLQRLISDRVMEKLLRNVSRFPVLQTLGLWDGKCADMPCFAEVYSSLDSISLHFSQLATLLDRPVEIESLSRRFSSVTELYLYSDDVQHSSL